MELIILILAIGNTENKKLVIKLMLLAISILQINLIFKIN